MHGHNVCTDQVLEEYESPPSGVFWAQVLAQRLHFNTFGGNPVCSAGGRAVLRAIDKDGIQANSAKVKLAPTMDTADSAPFSRSHRRGRHPGQLSKGAG